MTEPDDEGLSDCGRCGLWEKAIPRYDLSKGTYHPSITVARWNNDFSDGVQMGDVIARTAGRVGIRWDARHTIEFSVTRRYEYSVVSEGELAELYENAQDVFRHWDEQAKAEQYAEEGWLRAAENAGWADDPRGN